MPWLGPLQRKKRSGLASIPVSLLAKESALYSLVLTTLGDRYPDLGLP